MWQLIKDLFGWVSWLATQCINGVLIIYALLSNILPGFILFSDSHAWWHNLLLGVFWIGGYVYLAIKYFKLVGAVKDAMEDSAYEAYGCRLMPFWHWLCYIAAIALPFAIPYFEWPDAAKFLMIPLIGAPVLYLLVKGGAGFVFLLLRQLVILVMVALAGLLFLPLAVLALILLGIGWMLGETARGVQDSIGDIEGGGTCPFCGATVARGHTCSCGRSRMRY